MRLEGLHLLLTYRCTYTCRHCFLWGSPDQTGTMTCTQMLDLIEQAAASGVELVYFEGGEPTLAYPLILEGGRRARDLGLEWGVVTNCHFAESPADAALWFAPFKELGIADLALSSYAYLLGDKEERLLRNAVTAARDLELPLGVLEVGAPADLRDLGVACMDPGEIMFKGRAAAELAPEALGPWAADGEAAGAKAATDGEAAAAKVAAAAESAAGRRPDELTACPHEDFAAPGRAHVGCDGELQLCQGISAGNVWTSGLAGLLATFDAPRMPVIAEILRGGPWELARAHGIEPARARYADACHLCFETRTALRAGGLFPEALAPAQAYGVVE